MDLGFFSYQRKPRLLRTSAMLAPLIPVFAQFIGFFLLGYALARVGFLNRSEIASLNKVVAYIAMPALLFSGMAGLKPLELPALRLFLGMSLAALLTIALVWLALAALRQTGTRERRFYAFAGGWSNSGYLGLPLVLTLLANVAAEQKLLVFAFWGLAVDLIVVGPLVYMTMRLQDVRGRQRVGMLLRSIGENPFSLSFLAGLAGAYSAPFLPEAFRLPLADLGGAVAPLALLVMGAGLALYRVKAELGATLWVVVAGKLILHPVMAFLLVSLISRGDPLAPLVALLIAATPVASSAYISAELLRFRQGETARFIAVSTPLSALTLCLAGAIALALASMTALR